MYTRLYQQCNGTSHATSSATKFMPPHSCNYYVIKKQKADNLIAGATINIEYLFKCIDYARLEQDFKEVVEKESGSNDTVGTIQDGSHRLDPIYWGPAAWKFFEATAFGYPDNPSDDEKAAAFNFFESLRYLLPCEKCKEHYRENFEALPVNVESRDTLSRWVVEFHNIVNVSLRKPVVEYDAVYAKYSKGECPDCTLDSMAK